MKHFFIITFFIHAFVIHAISQTYTFTGKVIDAGSQEPLSFVSILVNKGNKSYITDIDGKFKITSPTQTIHLQFNLVGYEPIQKTINTDSTLLNIEIRLKKKKIELNEIVILPGNNPAHRIIKNVLDNRNRNNPERIHSFTYTSYNKFYFTVQEDSLQTPKTDENKNDTLAPGQSLTKIEKFVNKQHFFLSEFVTERHFKQPDKNIENVISSKISGLNDPVFVLLATQIQSFSFYNEYITILDKNFINPVSQGCFNRYRFILEDTLFTENNDSVFIISYKPLKGKKFEGLTGLLYINTNGYAIQNVTAIPSSVNDLFSVKIQQQYQLIDNKQWFPGELNTHIVFKNTKFKARNHDLFFTGIGRCYINNVQINPDVSDIKFSNIELDINPDAHKKDDTFWEQHRPLPLTKKDSATYHIIDSIGKKIKLEQKMRIFEALLNGYIPIGCFNLDYNKIISYNKYEGLKLGLGLATNQKVFKYASIGGFFHYGFKDQNWKYGSFVQFFPKWHSDTQFAIKYAHNVSETGSLHYLDEYTLNSTELFKNYFISYMDPVKEYETSFTTRMFKHLKYKIYLNRSDKQFVNYEYIEPAHSDTIQTATFTEIGLQLKFAYREKFMKTPKGQLISLGTKYPVVWMNIRKGTNWFAGNTSYTKLELKISKNFTSKSLGTTYLQVKTGTITGTLPISNLYSSFGCYETFTLFVENNFAAIRPGEFYSKDFASFFFRQNFGTLLFKGKHFKPEINFITNIGWGTLPEKWRHQQINFQTMDKGYIESGIMMNRILNSGLISWGIGCYYRYGHYRYLKTADNFAYKYSLLFNL